MRELTVEDAERAVTIHAGTTWAGYAADIIDHVCDADRRNGLAQLQRENVRCTVGYIRQGSRYQPLSC